MLMSFRGGSGIVVAKLADGKWSAPSAITTSGIGGGFQIGAEITDFVIVLNTFAAVNAFSENYITLGGNLSVSAGPFGRNAEASISKQMSPIYSYSKSKGLFAGVSIEGSVISERVEENCKFYKRRVTCRDILGGLVDPPDIAEGLYRALDQRVAAATINPPSYTSFGLATPAGSGGQTSPRPAELKLQPIVESAQCYQSPTKAQANSVPSNGPLGYHEMSPSNAIQPSFSPTGKSKPPIPAKSKQMNIKARALYDYIPDSSTANDDLAFIKGDLITVTDQSLGAWWKGICKGKIGMVNIVY
jgi:hypothetical protein